jgi:branched-chain amino acid aminotransferase
MNSQLVRIEAALHGYQEGLTLDSSGCVSEGSGENLFMVVGETLYTPGMGAAILPGITRNTVITLAREIGLEVVETSIPRGMLYSADELFFTGTAVEITPIRSLDKITIGNGSCGPVTKRIQDKFNDVVCNGNDPHGWLSYVGNDGAHTNGSARMGEPAIKGMD